MKKSSDELSLNRIFDVSRIIKTNTENLTTSQEVCQTIAKTIYQSFSYSKGKNDFALCRIFKSCSFVDFPPHLKQHLRSSSKGKSHNEGKYIALLGTFGEKKDWCNISNSKNHKALPINNPQAIQKLPMMLALFKQIGFEISQNQNTGSIRFLKKEDVDFGLFMIKEAKGNPLIPDQKGFVVPFGIKSVFGFGGMFSTGNLFTAIIFSKKIITMKQAEIFHSLVPALKFAQIENELKGRIFNGVKKTQSQNIYTEKLEIEIEKEKAETLNEELIRANKALLKLNDKLIRNNLQLNKTETKLTKSEELLKNIINNTTAVIFLKDTKGRYLLINKQFETLFNITEDEMMGKTDLDIFPKETAIKFMNNDKTVLECGEVIEWEETVNHGNKMHTYISVKFPIRRQNGDLFGVAGISTDITERKEAERNLESSLGLLSSIKNAQSKYISDNYSKQLFDNLLDEILKLTESEFGFIGEIIKGTDGNLYLKTHTITNIAWNNITRKLHEKNVAVGMEFHNLNSLFGTVITTGKPVISNDPSNDPQSGGIPKGHPPLKSFLGLPFYHNSKMIGMVGMANRPLGYNDDLVEYLQPFLMTCSNLLQAWRNDQRRRKAESALKERSFELVQKNLALKEILTQIEIEKNQFGKLVLTNVNKLLIPLLHKLVKKATRVERKYLDLLEKNLKEITSKLGPHIADPNIRLSPRESEVYNMVNGGLNTKEISSLLNLSPRTVETHRFNIRKKLKFRIVNET
jgi:PAS domain S-box-containing protein